VIRNLFFYGLLKSYDRRFTVISYCDIVVRSFGNTMNFLRWFSFSET